MGRKFKVTTPSKYTDKQSGQEKTSFKTLGRAFENEKGQINVYLDGLPPNGQLILFVDDGTYQGRGGGNRGGGGGGYQQQRPQRQQQGQYQDHGSEGGGYQQGPGDY